MKKLILVLTIILFTTTSCKKEELFPYLDPDGETVATEAVVSCDSGILINGCFANDNQNWTFPDSVDIKNVKFIHKNRDIMRIKTNSASALFTFRSIQQFDTGTYNVEIRVPKNTAFSMSFDFCIDVGFGGCMPLGSNFSIDTSSSIQLVSKQITIGPGFECCPANFNAACTGIADGVARIDYVKITKL